jgi:2-oxoglutarate ferredoxin oxidoreductase subunit delta
MTDKHAHRGTMKRYVARQPIVPSPKAPRGLVTILEARCKGCEFCVEFCPQDVLEMSTKFNAKGYHFPQVKFPEKCVNCQLCYYLCPEYAIFVTEFINNKRNQKVEATQPECVTASV